MKITIYSIVLLLSLSWLQAAPAGSLFDRVYELTASDGRKLRAKVLEFKVETVSVEAEANKTVYEIPYLKFNQLTQTQLHQLWAMEVNQKLGISIIPEDSSTLWNNDILEFAKKFSIERKILIPNTADYYYLTDYEANILGARAYYVRAYPNDLGDKTKLKHLEIEFANAKAFPLGKGESTIFGMAQDSKALDAAMKEGKETIRKKLTSSFGKGVVNTNGEHAFTRWDSKGYSFLLETRNLDALLLHVVPTSSLPSLDKDNNEK